MHVFTALALLSESVAAVGREAASAMEWLSTTETTNSMKHAGTRRQVLKAPILDESMRRAWRVVRNGWILEHFNTGQV